MSNIGKSYTEALIAKSGGFDCYDVDQEVQNRMGNLSMDKMADWMGHPYAEWLIIYIKASPSDIDALIDRYFQFPKPTIWGEEFKRIDGKSDKQSLLACYPTLLKS